jgi:hypothetical protein
MVQNHQIMHTCLRGRQLCQIMHTCLRGRQLLLKHKTCKQFRPGEILVKHNADLPDVYFDILAVVHRNQLPRRGCMYKHIVVSEWDIYVLKLHYMWKQDKNPREIISVLKLHNMWKQVKIPREITVTAIVYVQQAIDYSWYKTTNYSTFKNVLFKYKKNLNNTILLMVY